MTLIKDGREKERKLNTQWNCLFSWLMVKRQLHFLLKSSDPLFLNCLSFVFCSWIELNYPCVHDRVCFHLYYSSENQCIQETVAQDNARDISEGNTFMNPLRIIVKRKPLLRYPVVL